MARLRYDGLATGSAGSLTALTLGGSLTNSATSVTFSAALKSDNGTAVPTITGSDYIPLSLLDANGNLAEIVYLTAYTAAATTGTIGRGKEGTTGVAHASGARVAHGPTVEDASDSVLAAVAYNPGTISSVNIASATVADVDATNLAITFTVPASGKVLVRLSALATLPGSSTANALNWAIRESTTTIDLQDVGSAATQFNLRSTAEFLVTGLTPGDVKTYKFAHSRNTAGTGTTHAGGIAGAATMVVTKAP